MKHLIVIVLAMFLFLPASAAAQDRILYRSPDSLGDFSPRMLFSSEELGLSDAQKEQIAGLIAAHRDEIEPVREELREEASTLRELMTDATADRRTVLTQLELVLELENQVKIQRAELFLDVRDLLDAEQREKARLIFEERASERPTRIRERRQDNDGEQRIRRRQ
jgi:Spy/CpxP family protein refolding chaperone